MLQKQKSPCVFNKVSTFQNIDILCLLAGRRDETENDVLPSLPPDHYDHSWCNLDQEGLPGFLPGPPHFPLRGARPGWQMIENDENIDEKRRKKVAGLIELNGDLRFFTKREAGDLLNWMSPFLRVVFQDSSQVAQNFT